MSRIRAGVVVGLTLGLASITLILSTLTGAEIFGFSVSAFLLIVVGAFLVIRVPHNLVGTVLALGGAAWLLYTAAGEYARLSLRSGPFPAEYLAAWLGSWVGALLPASLAVLMLVFPDGRPPRRWRWLGVVLALVVGSALIGAVQLWGLPVSVLTDFDALDLEQRYLWVDLAFIVGFASAVPAAFSLFFRYRKGGVVERRQIKWLLAAAVLFATVVVMGIAVFGDQSNVWEWILSASMALLPVTVALAILRHRLYEIDRIISRTVSYAVVVGLLGLLAAALVAGMAVFLSSDDPLVVAVATLTVFALFNPLRVRVQRFVDRRFNRSRYDAERVIEGFAGSLRGQVDTEEVVEGWVGVVEKTMAPRLVGVWVRER